MTRYTLISVGVLTWLLSSLCADVAEVRLKDGSIVVGTIENLVDGEDLKLDTEHMDLVAIEWEAVDEIRSDSQLVLELFTGERIVGDIAMTGDKITVTSAGDQQTVVAPNQVFAIEDVNDDFWGGLSAHTDLGANIVRGNNQVTQYTLGAGIEYDATTTRPAWTVHPFSTNKTRAPIPAERPSPATTITTLAIIGRPVACTSTSATASNNSWAGPWSRASSATGLSMDGATGST